MNALLFTKTKVMANKKETIGGTRKNAEVLMWEDVIKNGWYILLRQQGGI